MIKCSGVRKPIIVEYTSDSNPEWPTPQQSRFQRNWDWFRAHAAEIYILHRGKYYCVAGQELFVADTSLEALAVAKATHPEDDGRFTGSIRREVKTRGSRPNKLVLHFDK
jgi:hypothetical protein